MTLSSIVSSIVTSIVYNIQGRIQDLWKGGGGAAATLFEDPLWNFKRGARAPCAPPPLNPLVIFGIWVMAALVCINQLF